MNPPRKSIFSHVPIDLTLWIGGVLTLLAGVWFVVSVGLGFWFPEFVAYAQSIGVWAIWKKFGYVCMVCGPVTISFSVLSLQHRIHNVGGDCELDPAAAELHQSVADWFSNLFVVLTGAHHRRRKFFVRSLFELLGRIAIADGKVSEKEQEFVSTIARDRFGFSQREIASALKYFWHGVRSTEDLSLCAERVADRLSRVPEILRILLDLLSQLSQVDGELHAQEHRALEKVALKFRMRLKRVRSPSATPSSANSRPQSPHEVLGVPTNASTEEVTRAFRKLALAYHPDRAVIRGLPPEFSAVSKERFLEVREAYESIRRKGGN